MLVTASCTPFAPELMGCVMGTSSLRGTFRSYIKALLLLELAGHTTKLFSLDGELGKSGLR